MSEAFSSPRNRTWTLALLAVCVLSAVASIVIGINDNLPGVLLAFLAAVAFVLVFTHPWRTARKFLLLLLASLLGLILFIVLSIITDTIVQNPGTPVTLLNLLESPAYETLITVFAMLLPAAFIVGAVGSLVMFIRGRRQAPSTPR